MQFYKIYDQPDRDEITNFIRSQSFCQLTTLSPSGRSQIGIFNPVCLENRFLLHLNRQDEQIADLRAGSRALLSFLDFLAVIPSHWVDAEYAGAATSYYRYAEFECAAELIDSPEAMRPVFEGLMGRFQPEGGYAPLDPASKTYRKSFEQLVVVSLSVRDTRTKWKLGQNRPADVRRKIAEKLRERAQGNDLRAAAEVIAALGRVFK